jgi:hypothetical protein
VLVLILNQRLIKIYFARPAQEKSRRLARKNDLQHTTSDMQIRQLPKKP